MLVIKKKVHYAGREQSLAESREKAWIVKRRGLLKKVIKNCLHCKDYALN